MAAAALPHQERALPARPAGGSALERFAQLEPTMVSGLAIIAGAELRLDASALHRIDDILRDEARVGGPSPESV